MKPADKRLIEQIIASLIGIGVAYFIGFMLVLPLLLQNGTRPDTASGLAVLVFAIVLAFWIGKLVVKIGK